MSDERSTRGKQLFQWIFMITCNILLLSLASFVVSHFKNKGKLILKRPAAYDKGFRSHTIIEFILRMECATLGHTSLTQIARIIIGIIIRVYDFFRPPGSLWKLKIIFPAVWFYGERESIRKHVKVNDAWSDFPIRVIFPDVSRISLLVKFLSLPSPPTQTSIHYQQIPNRHQLEWRNCSHSMATQQYINRCNHQIEVQHFSLT